MLKRIEFEAKNDQEAHNIASEKLGIQKDKIAIRITRDKKGIFSSGTALYEATPNISLALEGKTYLEGILQALDIECQMELRTLNDGSEMYFAIQSNQNALLIGREGKTLFALQYLLRQHLYAFTQSQTLVQLDIANYHENHIKQLEILAIRTAKEVAKTGFQVKLDPMSAYDRRIIHAKLSDWRDVTTQSEGEGETRALIIKPIK